MHVMTRAHGYVILCDYVTFVHVTLHLSVWIV
jgi:hypothetical protein